MFLNTKSWIHTCYRVEAGSLKIGLHFESIKFLKHIFDVDHVLPARRCETYLLTIPVIPVILLINGLQRKCHCTYLKWCMEMRLKLYKNKKDKEK